jgi:hypothetical protein
MNSGTSSTHIDIKVVGASTSKIVKALTVERQSGFLHYAHHPW